MTARAIVKALGGRWAGRYGMARCPAHKDRTPSLKVSDGPNGEPIFHCFAGCDWRDVKDALRQRGLLPEWVPGGGHGHTSKPRARPDPSKARNAADRADEAKRTQQALQIWRRAVPAPGTLVEKYLRARGITIPIPPSLRYLAAAKHKPTGLILPAMIGGVQGVNGTMVGVHRTFLCRDGTAKATVSDAKMTLGPIGGGAVRFGPAAQRLAVAEGIETALSIAQACPDLSVWSGISTSLMRRLLLPPQVREVVLCVDGDEAGDKAARHLAERFASEGRAARIAPAPDGQDYNDLTRILA